MFIHFLRSAVDNHNMNPHKNWLWSLWVQYHRMPGHEKDIRCIQWNAAPTYLLLFSVEAMTNGSIHGSCHSSRSIGTSHTGILHMQNNRACMSSVSTTMTACTVLVQSKTTCIEFQESAQYHGQHWLHAQHEIPRIHNSQFTSLAAIESFAQSQVTDITIIHRMWQKNEEWQSPQVRPAKSKTSPFRQNVLCYAKVTSSPFPTLPVPSTQPLHQGQSCCSLAVPIACSHYGLHCIFPSGRRWLISLPATITFYSAASFSECS